MLQLFAEKCTMILLEHGVIHDDQKNIYVYGFVLFWSTLSCIVSILFISFLFGYLSSAVIFLLFFMPIRMVAGGYHAKSCEACFIWTNSIAILCVMVSKCLWYIDNVRGFSLLWITLLFSFVYIWSTAPINMGKRSVDMDRILKNRKYAHLIIIIELLLILVMRNSISSYISYTAVTATYAVALMIYVVKREEVSVK